MADTKPEFTPHPQAKIAEDLAAEFENYTGLKARAARRAGDNSIVLILSTGGTNRQAEKIAQVLTSYDTSNELKETGVNVSTGQNEIYYSLKENNSLTMARENEILVDLPTIKNKGQYNEIVTALKNQSFSTKIDIKAIMSGREPIPIPQYNYPPLKVELITAGHELKTPPATPASTTLSSLSQKNLIS